MGDMRPAACEQLPQMLGQRVQHALALAGRDVAVEHPVGGGGRERSLGLPGQPCLVGDPSRKLSTTRACSGVLPGSQPS